MARFRPIAGLADGLRALEVLARHAPIDTAGFAHAASLEGQAAAALVELFQHEGYIVRLSHGALLVLTPMALEIALAGAAAATRGSDAVARAASWESLH